MPYIILFLLLIGFIRYLLAIIVTSKSTGPLSIEPSRVGYSVFFEMYSCMDREIEPGTWTYLGTQIMFKSYSIFGQVSERFDFNTELSRKGLLVKGHTNELGEEFVVEVYNTQAYPIKIRRGTTLGVVSFYRMPYTFLF